jgi:spore maturation protein CgeB
MSSLRLVVFGPPITSSWKNGHATVWRGLCRSLHAMGHSVVYYERDGSLPAAKRDIPSPTFCDLVLYADFESVRERAARDVESPDAVIVTSACPDAVAATALVVESNARVRAFYDLDAPETIAKLEAGESVPYVGPQGYRDFDLVLSISGGTTLGAIEQRLGARSVHPLYASVDPDVHFPAHLPMWASDLSFLARYAPERSPLVDKLFFEVARGKPDARFVLGGADYPSDVALPTNVLHVEHVAAEDHSAFYGSANFALNVTRPPMAKAGFCPPARLFEAAASGTPIVSDGWEGLETFLDPGTEIVVVQSTEDVLKALEMSGGDRARIAAGARRRILAHHTSTTRAHELVAMLTDPAVQWRGGTGAIEPMPEARSHPA